MKPINISIRTAIISTVAVLWVVVPTLIMIWFWFRWYYAFPTVALGVWGMMKSIKCIFENDKSVCIIGWPMISLFIFIGLWMLLIGIGGFWGQEYFDNSFRNATLMALVDNSWPVVSNEYKPFAYLCYYFTYWIIPAIFGKLFASHEAAYIALYIYSYIGLTSMMMIILHKFKKYIFFLGFIIFSFGTLDIINIIIFKDILNYENCFINGTMLFSAPTAPYLGGYVYNQGFPTWVIMALFVNYRKLYSFQLLLFASLLSMAPFMAVPLAPLMIYNFFKHLKKFTSVANVAGLLIIILTGIFFQSNTNGGEISWMFSHKHIDTVTSESIPIAKVVIWYICFWLFNFLIYLPFIWKQCKLDSYFWLIGGATLVFATFIHGYGNSDIGWKLPTAFTFYILLQMIIYIGNMDWHKWKFKNYLIVFVLIFGSASYFHETKQVERRFRLGIAVRYIKNKPQLDYILDRSESRIGHLFDPDRMCYENFIVDEPSIYSKYFMPKTK